MEQILKHKRLLSIGLVVGAVFLSFGASTRTAYADYEQDVAACTYSYSSDGSSIKRTNCDNNNVTFSKSGTGVYTYKTAPAGPAKTSCSTTITVDKPGSSTAGYLGGTHSTVISSPKAGSSVACTKISKTKITIKKSSDTSVTAGYAVVEDQLSSLVASACGSDTGGQCTSAQQRAIGTCTDSALKQIDKSDPDKNKKFKQLFSACLAATSPSLGSAATISGALSDTIYDDIKAAVSAANSADGQLPSANDDSDKTANCENSAGALGWIMCPIIEGISKAAQGIFTGLIQPLLYTKPLSIDAGDPTFRAWSSFRIIADILLVIALLVVVFGQAFFGGTIDAYTAKKILPRILLAAIGINLSYYLVAAAVDVSNVLGNGIQSLIEYPFKASGTFEFQLTGTGALGGVAGLAFGGLWVAGGTIGTFLPWLLFTILVPLLLVLIAIVATVIIRRGLIILLVLLAPVAFALYCLPNTEKYFKQWWELLIKTLMVYPIISALFGIGNVLGVTISMANSTDSPISGGIASLLAAIAPIVPLFLIPFAFSLAGGVLGRVHDLAQSGRQKANGMMQSKREAAAERLHDAKIGKKEHRYNSLMSAASKRNNALARTAIGLTGRAVGGYNLQAQAAETRARVMKQLADQTANGDDSEIRALTVNKQWAMNSGIEGTDWRTNKDGTREFRTLGGAWSKEANVDAAHRRWGKNSFAQQGAVSYEMGKAATEEEVERVGTNFKHVAQGQGGWGLKDDQASGVWIGAAYAHQNDHLEYKHMNKDGVMTEDGMRKFVAETYEKKGTYALSQNGAATIKQLQQIYAQTNDPDIQQKIEGIAEQFVHDYGTGGGQQTVAGADGETRTVDLPPEQGQVSREGTPAPVKRIVSTQGSAHLTERVAELAKQTGVLQSSTKATGQYSDPREMPQKGIDPRGNERAPGPVDYDPETESGGNSRNQKGL